MLVIINIMVYKEHGNEEIVLMYQGHRVKKGVDMGYLP